MTFTQIIAEARRLVKATTSSYLTGDIVVSANRAEERITQIIRDSQGRWQWDDSNNEDLPIATTGLFANQQDYELDLSHYRIERLELKGQNQINFSIKLKPFDISDVHCMDVYNSGATGTPEYYDKIGNSLFLYPTPNYTQQTSLKIFYERGPDYFTDADTTKTPGFNPLFHRLVALWAAYDYALINQLAVAKGLADDIALQEAQLKDYYALRDRDEHIKLSVRRHSFR